METKVGETWIDTNCIHRTLCSVLEDMRKCFKTRNFSSLLGLIEEAQIMGNKMEASLYDKSDFKDWMKAKPMLKREIEDLIEQKDKLEMEIKSLKGKIHPDKILEKNKEGIKE